MKLNYPSTFPEIGPWCAGNGVTVNEGRVRFAQYAILRAIAYSDRLSRILVFKGGNALDFVWHPNRSTQDLDFSADMSLIDLERVLPNFEDLLQTSIERSLRLVSDQLGIVFAIHSVRQQPPGKGKTFITFELRIGYALPDQFDLLGRMGQGRRSQHVIPVEISLNEPICADEGIEVQATHRLRVSTLEDIVAEKLRALLQQPIRNRSRRQDLLDVALLVQEHKELDHSRVAEFLCRKSAARNVPVSRAAFHNPELAERAKQDYDDLQPTTRIRFLPYEEALETLLTFTDTLPIPLHATDTSL